MIKFINYLILYSTLFLYCCNKDYIPQKDNFSNPTTTTRKNLPTSTDKPTPRKNSPTSTDKPTPIIILTKDEQDRFKVLIDGFNKISELYQDRIDNNKYTNFFNWISKDTKRQKELANAFEHVYQFLRKKSIKSKILDFPQAIVNVIENSYKNEFYDAKTSHDIKQFFIGVLEEMMQNNNNTNEKLFNFLKKELGDLTNHVAGLMGEEVYEGRLDQNQQKTLKIFYTILVDEIYRDNQTRGVNMINKFLQLSDINIQTTLNHIDKELSKCSENHLSRQSLKASMKEYFDKINTIDYELQLNDEIISDFTKVVISDCGSGG
ncbi:Mlp lipoprotein family protein (plasmid) [Borrelia crocidurae DOU]|uniref:Mlp lipoprotein family protein n=1 Tax=Borrelia crocidurae DOU TaxID=1293575 RepID=W5SKB1_9SPIR|nr:Mlp family lipoprotein [Borrelia crocidurae]AHH07093.1 Mlp lipoprotein family protein [Borrelia crocidurae DOU]